MEAGTSLALVSPPPSCVLGVRHPGSNSWVSYPFSALFCSLLLEELVDSTSSLPEPLEGIAEQAEDPAPPQTSSSLLDTHAPEQPAALAPSDLADPDAEGSGDHEQTANSGLR